MERFLALPPAERELAFQQAGAARGLASGSVEKDFWVCFILRELFALPEYGDHLTFKGGTSLSKAWGLIDRFSEDIDLTINREVLGFGGEHEPAQAKTRNAQRRRLQQLKQACRDAIAGTLAPALTSRLQAMLQENESWNLALDDEDPDGQTLLFTYPRSVAAATATYVRPVVKLEFGARSDPWPAELRPVTSIVAEEFPQLHATPTCTVRALRPERTFWEKVMLLQHASRNVRGNAPAVRFDHDDDWVVSGGVQRVMKHTGDTAQQVLRGAILLARRQPTLTPRSRGTRPASAQPGTLRV